MNRTLPNDEWSDSLKAATREALKNLDVPGTSDGSLPLKHIGKAFGTISLGDLLNGKLRIVDRRTGAEGIFSDADALVAAGWAVD